MLTSVSCTAWLTLRLDAAFETPCSDPLTADDVWSTLTLVFVQTVVHYHKAPDMLKYVATIAGKGENLQQRIIGDAGRDHPWI